MLRTRGRTMAGAYLAAGSGLAGDRRCASADVRSARPALRWRVRRQRPSPTQAAAAHGARESIGAGPEGPAPSETCLDRPGRGRSGVLFDYGFVTVVAVLMGYNDRRELVD